jgi:hypothetical protein
MKKQVIALVAFAAVALTASVTSAATLATAPLPVGADSYRCQVVNISSRPRSVLVRIFAANGGSVANTSCDPLPAGDVCTLNGDASSSYCVIDASSKNAVRAAFHAIVNGLVAGTVEAR